MAREAKALLFPCVLAGLLLLGLPGCGTSQVNASGPRGLGLTPPFHRFPALNGTPAPAISQQSQAAGQGAGYAFSVLYTFTGGADGAWPGSGDVGLVRDEEGNLYGTAPFGGACWAYCGVLFKVDPSGNETVLHSFSGGEDGGYPNTDLVRDEEGDLYGTTSGGGNLSACPGGCGLVFKLDRSGKETVLYTFAGGADGAYPGNVIRDEEGNLYSTTFSGGGNLSACGGYGCGVVFKLDREGKETVLYNFTGAADGANPIGGLIRDEAGDLLGTTYGGGSSYCGCGVVFKLDRAGKETVLYSFSGGPDGGTPWAGLVRDWEGNLYGTTQDGGNLNNPIYPGIGCGVVFKVDRAGKETVLYSFNGGTDGCQPLGGRLLWLDGNLYGTASLGGAVVGPLCASGCGVVFKLDRAGNEAVLYTFGGGADGVGPYSGLTADEEGNLYGTTNYGGDVNACFGIGCGVVYKLSRTDHEPDDDQVTKVRTINNR